MLEEKKDAKFRPSKVLWSLIFILSVSNKKKKDIS